MDRKQAAALCRDNLRAMEMYASLLKKESGGFSHDEINAFANDCGLDPDTAFSLLAASLCGLEPDIYAADKLLLTRYLFPALHAKDPKTYSSDPYFERIRFPDVSREKWSITRLEYSPYEVFPCGETVLYPDGREIVPLGYFSIPFSYPAVLENGLEWMALKPNEMETMKAPIEAACGNAAVFGLGLGYYAYMISEKQSVHSVTVIERDESVISLFREYLLPQFPHKDKIRLVQADAFEYAQSEMKKEAFDFAFADLWHDISDGLSMYLQFRKTEIDHPGVHFQYWIEQSMLIFLRSLFLDDWIGHAGKLDRLLTFSDHEDQLFTLESIRRLALKIDPAELQ